MNLQNVRNWGIGIKMEKNKETLQDLPMTVWHEIPCGRHNHNP